MTVLGKLCCVMLLLVVSVSLRWVSGLSIGVVCVNRCILISICIRCVNRCISCVQSLESVVWAVRVSLLQVRRLSLMKQCRDIWCCLVSLGQSFVTSR